jgi:uridine monophosphate synthetase
MTEITAEIKHELARQLGLNGLFKFGSFTLKSGIESPVYIDLRQAQSYPETLRAVVATYGEMLKGIDDNIFLAGVPEAGTPLAAATGYEYRRKLLQPRKVVKDHGTKSSIEGAFKRDDRVVLIDDLITKGDSKLEAIKQVEDAGLIVDRFIVLIDREQGGLEHIREAGYKIEAAMTISEVLGVLLSDGTLSQQKHDEVIEFIRNN